MYPTLHPLKISLSILLLCSVLSSTAQVDSTAQSPQNPQLPFNEFYFDCTPPELEIKQFEDDEAHKNWQVVVGRPVKYKARPKSDFTWNWILGDFDQNGMATDDWLLAPEDPTMFSHQGVLLIPASELPTDNSKFGDNYGVLKVEADLNDDGGFSADEIIYAEADQQVKVYFSKYEKHFSGQDVNDNPILIPNWLHYWAPLVTNYLETTGMKMYDTDNMVIESNLTPITIQIAFSTDPVYNFEVHDVAFNNANGFLGINHRSLLKADIDPSPNGINYVITGLEFRIELGNACSNICFHTVQGQSDGVTIVYKGTKNQGIACFQENIVHETEHSNIFLHFWKDGYVQNQMDVDGDFYPDSWESSPEATIYGFDPADPVDEYDISNYNAINYANNTNNQIDPNATAGTNFEEIQCRALQDMTDSDALKEHDWSYDPNNKYQGKNW